MNILYQAQRDNPAVTAGFEVYPNTGKIVRTAPILHQHLLGKQVEQAPAILKRLGYNRLLRLTPQIGDPVEL